MKVEIVVFRTLMEVTCILLVFKQHELTERWLYIG